MLTTAYLQSEIGNLAFGPRLPLTTRHTMPAQRSLYAVGTTGIMDFFVTPGAYETLYPTGGTAATAAKIDLTAVSGFQLFCAVNAASPISYPSGAVAPGEVVTLYGQQFPPGTKVSFDGVQAPILYAGSNQINAVVPFEIASPTTNLSLEIGQQTMGPITLPVSQAIPAIFPNGIINQDGSVNSPTHPAALGSIITVYMTGLGQMMPAIADGAIGPLTAPFPVPVLGVSASVGPTYVPTPSAMAPVLYAGQAPGLVAGTVQVNIKIPTGATTGATTLWVYVGNYSADQPIMIE